MTARRRQTTSAARAWSVAAADLEQTYIAAPANFVGVIGADGHVALGQQDAARSASSKPVLLRLVRAKIGQAVVVGQPNLPRLIHGHGVCE